MITVKFPGIFVEAEVSGHLVRFFVHNPTDVIQQHHFAGEFYEPEELSLIAKYVSPATRYLDIGANVGNHVLYVCRILGVRSAAVIEPNGPAIAILKLNLRLNGLESVVDTTMLGYGLSDAAGRADMENESFNLGGARFVADDNGPFELRSGDELIGDRDFDFVKIDTEGMELKCLRGLASLIARCRPVMLIEVDDGNAVAFLDWCADNDYVIRQRVRRYTSNENFLVTPT